MYVIIIISNEFLNALNYIKHIGWSRFDRLSINFFVQTYRVIKCFVRLLVVAVSFFH